MAHFAFVGSGGVVVDVIVGRDENDGGVDWEQHYSECRGGLRCLRTSYRTVANTHPEGRPFRGNYAGPGFTYRDDLDAFIPPYPGEGWVLDEATFTWVEAT